MPFNSPSLAFFIALLISSFVTSLPKRTVKSVIDPVGVGTRTASPVILPSNCGNTLPTALAAPVVVGIILKAAALARLRSLW